MLWTMPTVVQVSSLLDLGNGHSLKTLAEESKAENATMRSLTLKGFQDGVAIKVLTIVTLVYLPATVVSVSCTRCDCNDSTDTV